MPAFFSRKKKKSLSLALYAGETQGLNMLPSVQQDPFIPLRSPEKMDYLTSLASRITSHKVAVSQA